MMRTCARDDYIACGEFVFLGWRQNVALPLREFITRVRPCDVRAER